MKCGIEIHQRLAGRKLFCGCPSTDSPALQQTALAEAKFARWLHPVRSELGEIDAAARAEWLRQRKFSYTAPLARACLVEADEEPPHTISEEALLSAIVVCKLLKSKIVDEIQVMRKIVIDGSNTSGFQRTALIGLGGEIQTSFGAIKISTVCLEEESAGIVEGKDTSADYELSRLGIPLIEIATAPEISSGKQAQEVALAIGALLRKTGLVQRGIGSIRQDLNVSIEGGVRVEIKGVQELSMISETVEMEARRQQKLIELSDEIRRRKAKIEELFVDLTEIFSQTSCQLLSKAIASGGRIMGLRLPNHEGILGTELLPGRRYGTELSDYAKLAGLKGIIHSDENLSKYGFSDDEIAEVKAALSILQGDAFIIAAGERQKVQNALSEICRRANFEGVPEETRRANPDGTSSYMRPLPGKARLYPETDLPPIEITPSILKRVEEEIARIQNDEKIKEKLLSLLNSQLAEQLAGLKDLLSHSKNPFLPNFSPELSAFAAAVERGIDPTFAASILVNTLQSMKKEGVPTKRLDEHKMMEFFAAYQKKEFAKAASQEVLKAMCEENLPASKAVAKLGVRRICGEQLRKLIENEKLGMKELMSKYRLQVEAEEAQKLFGSLRK